jgi:hypothetical protein
MGGGSRAAVTPPCVELLDLLVAIPLEGYAFDVVQWYVAMTVAWLPCVTLASA